MSRPRVFVIVLSWNGGEELKACLGSLLIQTYPQKTLLVVDNGSRDKSPEMVRRDYPEVELRENGKNLGFAEGNNVGIRLALKKGADYIALLNQDARAHPLWLEELVRAAEEDPQIGALSSRILLDPPGTRLNSTGIEMNLAGLAWDRGFGQEDGKEWQKPAEVLGVTGGAMFLRARALKEVGLFDPGYFAYYEDLDLSLRLREAGYRLLYVPGAVVYHRFSSTLGENSPQKAALFYRNRLRLILKHFPPKELLRHGRSILREEGLFLAKRLLLGPRKLFWLRLWSYGQALSMLPEAYRYRRQKKGGGELPPWWPLLHPSYEPHDPPVGPPLKEGGKP